ncbi:hypothetical protein pv_56 [Pithovirus sibericum]|uniref:Uncharacterized protein n=1 Tax=Pithovirus sibericum TaxID=1450746 RepID=W5S4E7_9VIRU|nr:hypothetical protein pv_56 [Pithovirus sibericum]AHH01623.1 hypothetical protein pv_56 [Pithovirus sibericum]
MRLIFFFCLLTICSAEQCREIETQSHCRSFCDCVWCEQTCLPSNLSSSCAKPIFCSKSLSFHDVVTLICGLIFLVCLGVCFSVAALLFYFRTDLKEDIENVENEKTYLPGSIN